VTNFLERLKSPGDLKGLSLGELKQLAAEIRERIVDANRATSPVTMTAPIGTSAPASVQAPASAQAPAPSK
jgi:hypothetical protein